MEEIQFIYGVAYRDEYGNVKIISYEEREILEEEKEEEETEIKVSELLF